MWQTMGYGYGMVRCGRLWVMVMVWLDVADYGLGLG